MVGRGRGIGLGLGVDSDSLVGDLGNISVVVVGGVTHMLGTAIRKSNGVRSSDNTTSISSLSSVEVSLGVVISNSVLVGVGFVLALGLNIRGSLVGRGRFVSWGRFIRGRGIGWGGFVSRCWGIGRCVVDNRGIGGGRCVGRGMVDSMVGNNRGSMNCMMKRGSMMDGVSTESCERHSWPTCHKGDKSNQSKDLE